MKKKYPVVALIGDLRYKEKFLEEADLVTFYRKELVLLPNLNNGKSIPELSDEDIEKSIEMDKQRIDMSDKILVLVYEENEIDKNTSILIAYAKKKRKKINYYEIKKSRYYSIKN